MQALVSILIPAYTHKELLHKAIDSCLLQSYPKLEVIVLSDSQIKQYDGSEVLVRSIVESNDNGIAASRNRLIREAKGEYIAWLDADDTMHPERIAKQVAFLQEHPEIDLVGTYMIDSNTGKELSACSGHENIKALLWYKNCVFQPSLLSRNFYVKENIFYQESMKNSAEDYELWLRIIHIKRFDCIPLPLTNYNLSSSENLAEKRTKNDFYSRIQYIWDYKWPLLDTELTQDEKDLFIRFIYSNFELTLMESQGLLNTLKLIQNSFKRPIHRSICNYFRMRVWKNMPWSLKMKNILLLIGLFSYYDWKRLKLVP